MGIIALPNEPILRDSKDDVELRLLLDSDLATALNAFRLAQSPPLELGVAISELLSRSLYAEGFLSERPDQPSIDPIEQARRDFFRAFYALRGR